MVLAWALLPALLLRLLVCISISNSIMSDTALALALPQGQPQPPYPDKCRTLAQKYCQNSYLADCAGAGPGWVALRGRGASRGFEDCNVYPFPPAPAVETGLDQFAANQEGVKGHRLVETAGGSTRSRTRSSSSSSSSSVGTLCWRCYSPAALNENKTAYRGNGSTAYCTRDDEIQTVLTTCQFPARPDPGPFSTATEVFVPGEAGYPSIRIPSVALAADNHVLNAFAECRNFTGDGSNPNRLPPGVHEVLNTDVCQKRSSDGGVTWTPLRIVARGAMLGSQVSVARARPITFAHSAVHCHEPITTLGEALP